MRRLSRAATDVWRAYIRSCYNVAIQRKFSHCKIKKTKQARTIFNFFGGKYKPFQGLSDFESPSSITDK